MKTNDLKKGMRVQLANGWYAIIMDNKKGNTRLAEVQGTYTEIGSVYSHDIRKVEVSGKWEAIEHTDAQTKLKSNLAAMGW
jgi:hypothetical protein